MAIKTIVTDLGNVVLMFDPNIVVYDRFIELSGKSRKEVEDAIGFRGGIFRKFSKGEILSEEFYEHLLKELEISIPLEEFKIVWSDIFTLNSRVIDLYRKLSLKYRMILLSNLDAFCKEHVMKYFRIGFCTWYLFSCDVGMEKPDLRIYEYAFRFCNCKKDEVVFVDDLFENVYAAQTFGFHTVQYTGDFEKFCEELKKLGVEV